MKIKDEKAIESYLKEEVEKRGALCLKFASPSMVGYPDRICTLRDGRVVWVECKAVGQKPRKLQIFRHRQLMRKGQLVEVVASYKDVDELITKYYA